jgi:hypothetical protein
MVTETWSNLASAETEKKWNQKEKEKKRKETQRRREDCFESESGKVKDRKNQKSAESFRGDVNGII